MNQTRNLPVNLKILFSLIRNILIHVCSKEAFWFCISCWLVIVSNRTVECQILVIVQIQPSTQQFFINLGYTTLHTAGLQSLFQTSDLRSSFHSRLVKLTVHLRILVHGGRAIAQEVSRRLPPLAARVRAQVMSYGICGGQSGTGVGFLRVLRFLLPILILEQPFYQLLKWNRWKKIYK
jgi:hypothetical protein